MPKFFCIVSLQMGVPYGVGMGLFFALFGFIFTFDPNSIAAGLLAGAVAGMLFGPTMAFYVVLIWLAAQRQFALLPGETLLKQGPATHMVGLGRAGGPFRDGVSGRARFGPERAPRSRRRIRVCSGGQPPAR